MPASMFDKPKREPPEGKPADERLKREIQERIAAKGHPRERKRRDKKTK